VTLHNRSRRCCIPGSLAPLLGMKSQTAKLWQSRLSKPRNHCPGMHEWRRPTAQTTGLRSKQKLAVCLGSASSIPVHTWLLTLYSQTDLSMRAKRTYAYLPWMAKERLGTTIQQVHLIECTCACVHWLAGRPSDDLVSWAVDGTNQHISSSGSKFYFFPWRFS